MKDTIITLYVNTQKIIGLQENPTPEEVLEWILIGDNHNDPSGKEKFVSNIRENTADNGALYIAYEAFKLTEQGQDTSKIDGYTPDQRFCLSIARIWRVKTRDEFMRNYVNTNSHSPAMWRVNGPLMNFDPFYTAFNVQPGDKNYKADGERIRIW